jgi:hypothetical protein
VVYSLALGFLGMRLARTPDVNISSWSDPILQARDTQEPIVVASALEFSPMWWYADRQMRPQLHYLADLEDARMHSDLIPEYSLALERSYTPMQMDDYGSFVQSHRHFLLYCHGQSRLEW